MKTSWWTRRRRSGARGLKPWAMGFATLLAAVWSPVAAHGQSYLPEPTNPAYYDYVAAAGQDVEIDKDVLVTGNLHANEEVELAQGVHVTGDVSAVDEVENSGTVTGTILEGAAPVALPAPPTEAEARALADRIFEDDVHFTLDEVVDDIVFVNGDARFDGALNGTGAVIAMGDIRLKKGSPGQLLASTSLSLIAHGDIRLDKKREFRGVLVAAEDIEIKKQSSFEGVAIAGDDLDVDKDGELTFLQLDEPPQDTEPPTFADFLPTDGSVLSTATPSISATFDDDSSGVDSQTFQLLFDDVDRTAEATVTASGFSFTPSDELENALYFAEVFLSDLAGNPGEAAWSFIVAVDADLPSLAIVSPADPVVFSPPEVAVEYSDAGSGLDLPTLEVLLDGAAIISSCTVGPSSALCTPAVTAGSHLIEVQIADLAGNLASASRAFELIVDTVPPTVTIASPTEGLLVGTPTILVTGSAADDQALAGVTVNGTTASLEAGSYSAAVALAEGANGVQATATDTAGNQSSTVVSVSLDSVTPLLALSAPENGAVTNLASVAVQGSASDAGGAVTVEINGVSVPLDEGAFDSVLALVEGVNSLVVSATDAAGNETTSQLEVTRFEVPEVEIVSPEDLSLLGAASVEVSGVVSPSVTSVTVNGVTGGLNGGSFTAAGVPLVEGSNILTASAADAMGRFSTDSIVVVLDVSPPRVVIQHPADGSTVVEGLIAVRGLVNDIVPGTVNSQQVTVEINGQAAAVANRAFLLEQVALVQGENTLTATAVDQNGNSSSSSVTVTFAPSTAARIGIVSGDLQSAVIGTTLAAPLTVELIDGAGLPVAGETVLFKVVDNDGDLGGGARRSAATTDASGQAAATFTLGLHAGAGVQVVEASAVGFGRVDFFETGLSGAPAQIVVDQGSPQVGLVGSSLPRPLVALVVDSGFNRLAGVSVDFAFSRGGGLFDNGLSQTTVVTDTDGRAIVSPDLGPDPGVSNNVITASVAGHPEIAPATFAASARVAGDPAETVVSGIVLDNSELPVPGVTMEIAGTAHSVQTDTNGIFAIENAPVGMVHLVADGSTTTRPGQWPHLEFTLTTIPGAENTLGRPIYMLPLDTSDELFVDESTGGVLTLADYPGFALEIEANSVEFPDGTRSGTVRVVPVHGDKVPMTPTAGQQPMLAVTIQPVGAAFDPPARISFPNTCGLAPGTTVEFFSFDHDLEQFVSIGPSVVSEDGLVIVSKEGFGVLKAGWHWPMGPFGLPISCPNFCPECSLCFGGGCLPVPGGFCDDGDSCTSDDACDEGGGCSGTPLQVGPIEGPCLLAVGASGNFTSSSNDPDKLEWEATGGSPPSGSGPSFSTSFSSPGAAIVEVGCGPSKESKDVDVGDTCPPPNVLSSINKLNKLPENPDAAGANEFEKGEPQLSDGCVDGGQWCVALNGVEWTYYYGVRDVWGQRTNIPNANGPEVDNDNCKRVLKSVEPTIPVYGVLVPTREEYWSRQATIAHENWHETELLKTFDDIIAEFQGFLSGRCEECKQEIPESELLAEFETIQNRKIQEWSDAAHKPGAWEATEEEYNTLTAAIRARATTNGWRRACRN